MKALNNSIDLPSGLAFNLILVEGGIFSMGSPEGAPGGAKDEQPAHSVQVRSFYMGQYPVTQALWESLMGYNPSFFPGPNRPVEQVSWYDAAAFCNRLSQQLGLTVFYYSDEQLTRGYALKAPLSNDGPIYFNPSVNGFRLPTEAEWEYAARGGKYSEAYQYAGSDRLKQVGWFSGNSGGETHEVGLLPPNEAGLNDMSGNVWEWCEDWYGERYYEACGGAGLTVDPKGPETGVARVHRGGSWLYDAGSCRPACRNYWNPTNRNRNLGFRLVRSLEVGPFQPGL